MWPVVISQIYSRAQGNSRINLPAPPRLQHGSESRIKGRQVERDIKPGRAEVVAEARLVAAETAVAKSRKMGKLEPMAWHQ